MRLFAIAAQTPGELEGLQEDLGLAVTLLADPEAAAIESFGMLDPHPVPPRVMAQAGTFYIDPRGILRQRWLPDSYRERPDPETILSALK